MLLEKPQELELERRSDAGLVGFKPWARIFDVAGLQGTRPRLEMGEFLQRIHDLWPPQVLVEPLVLIGLQASIASRFAIRMIQVLDGPAGNRVELVGNPAKVTGSSLAGVDERQGEHVILSHQVRVEPWPCQLEVKLIGTQHAIVLHAVKQ